MTITRKPQSTNCSEQIDGIRKRFDSWRKSHKPRMRIPDRLWDAAVQAAQRYGLHRVARALHLDYYALKKRLDGCDVVKTDLPFIELTPAVSGSTPECIIELEKRDGAKIRFHLKGMEAPDLNALSDAFWRNRR
ncbi:MAG TPA: hypothetical protein VMG30_19575 [Acidobacteriota bacterium]|nr:hypothetical protein [Acidobacteriota bacterium]